MLFGAFSCAGKKSDDTPSMITVSEMESVAYKKSTVRLPDEIQRIYCFEPYSAGERFFVIGSGETTPMFWSIDRDLEEAERIEIPEFRIGVFYVADVAEDGKIVEFLLDADYGDLPDPNSPDYDADKYEAAAQYSYAVRTYSPEGELLSHEIVTGYPEEPDGSEQLTEIASDGELVIVQLNGGYEVLNIDGAYISALSAGEGETIEEIGKDRSGSLVCAVKTSDEKVQIREINADGTLADSSITYDIPENIHDKIYPGTGKYSMFLRSYSTIYGVDEENGSITELFSTTRSGVQSRSVRGYILNDDGSFTVIEDDYVKLKVRTYTECTQEELDAKPVLNVGIFYESNYMPELIDYAEDEMSDIRIDYKVYTANGADEDSAKEEVAQDAISGSLPDVIITRDGQGDFGGIDLIQKGGLCEMYEFLDNDEDLNRDSFIESYLRSSEKDGHLYVMPHRFTINLGYLAKTKYVSDIDKFTPEALIELLENCPDGMDLAYQYIDSFYSRLQFIDLKNWIDFDNATCDFDSESFINCLEFLSEFDSSNNIEYNYETETEAERRERETRIFRSFIDDTALLMDNQGIYDYTTLKTVLEGTFNGDPVTVLGSPEEDGGHIRIDYFLSDSFGINAASDKKELAWEFVKLMFDDYMYTMNKGYAGFPATKSGLALKEEIDSEPKTYDDLKDYTGLVYLRGYDASGKVDLAMLGELTDEDIALVNSYIDKAEPANGDISFPTFDLANDFYNIFYEETDRLQYGEVTAQECADALQSRISILLAEQLK